MPWFDQRWQEILFVHWHGRADVLEPLVAPRRLAVFSGVPWLSVVGLRAGVPRRWGVPLAPAADQVNVRTYVEAPDGAAILFLRILTSSRIMALGARAGRLPGEHAEVQVQGDGDLRSVDVTSASGEALRIVASAQGPLPANERTAWWLVGGPTAWGYGTRGGRARVRHAAWELAEAEVQVLEDGLVEGLVSGPPARAHVAADQDARIWARP